MSSLFKSFVYFFYRDLKMNEIKSISSDDFVDLKALQKLYVTLTILCSSYFTVFNFVFPPNKILLVHLSFEVTNNA